MWLKLLLLLKTRPLLMSAFSTHARCKNAARGKRTWRLLQGKFGFVLFCFSNNFKQRFSTLHTVKASMEGEWLWTVGLWLVLSSTLVVQMCVSESDCPWTVGQTLRVWTSWSGGSAGAESGGGKFHIFRVNLFSLYQVFLLTGTVRRPGPGGPTPGRVFVQAAAVRQSAASVVVGHHADLH